MAVPGLQSNMDCLPHLARRRLPCSTAPGVGIGLLGMAAAALEGLPRGARGALPAPLPTRCVQRSLTGAQPDRWYAGAIAQRKRRHLHSLIQRLLRRPDGCGAGRQLAGLSRRHRRGVGGGVGRPAREAQHGALRCAQPGHFILGGPGGGRGLRQGCGLRPWKCRGWRAALQGGPDHTGRCGGAGDGR